jgi:hypothetical protein
MQRAFANGGSANTPALDQVVADWRTIISAADPWLDRLTSGGLAKLREFEVDGRTLRLWFGSMLQRTIYPYWYHTGENRAIRQMLGQAGLPEFVGKTDDEGAVPASGRSDGRRRGLRCRSRSSNPGELPTRPGTRSGCPAFGG